MSLQEPQVAPSIESRSPKAVKASRGVSWGVVLFCIVWIVPGDRALAAEPFAGKFYTDGDRYADTWVATDALGRTQPGVAEVGHVKANRFVGIFYWTWHVPRGTGGPNDNTKLIATAKDGKIDWPENGCPHHWGEPELGYYMMTDTFVLRKHASMLPVTRSCSTTAMTRSRRKHSVGAIYNASAS